MGWEHQADFVAALKKAKCGSEKKIHKVAHLAIHHKKWYKHVVKNIRDFFGKGFRRGDSRLMVAYVVDAILKADAKSTKPVYAKRFQPWLRDLFGGCRSVAKDHKNLTQLADLWKKFFKAETITPIEKLLKDTQVQAQIEVEKLSKTVHEKGLMNLESILEENQTKRKMTLSDRPAQKKRRLNPAPQVTVQAVGADPRARIDPRTGMVPAANPTPITIHTTQQVVPANATQPQDPRLQSNQASLPSQQQSFLSSQFQPMQQYPPAPQHHFVQAQFPPPSNFTQQFPPDQISSLPGYFPNQQYTQPPLPPMRNDYSHNNSMKWRNSGRNTKPHQQSGHIKKQKRRGRGRGRDQFRRGRRGRDRNW